MHQGKCMHHFDGSRDAQRTGTVDGEQVASRQSQQRAHAFAALQGAVTHRIEQAAFHFAAGRDQAADDVADGFVGFCDGIASGVRSLTAF
jgi:hypothetical protein